MLVEPLRDRELALAGAGLADLVDRERDDAGAEAHGRGERLIEPLAAIFEVDRVDDRLAAEQLEAGLDHRRLGRVEHQRQRREPARLAYQLVHVGHTVAADEVDADIGDVRALAGLVAHDVGHLLPLLFIEQALEAARAVGVGALADDQERSVLAIGHGAEQRRGGRWQTGLAARPFDALDGILDRADVLSRRAAAAPDDADAVVANEAGVGVGERVGREVVDGPAVLDVRQPRVGRAEQRQRGALGEEA